MDRPHQIALRYLGTPFKHRGRSIKNLDCVGLLVMVAREIGMPHTDLKVYGREPTGNTLRDMLRANFGMPVDRPAEIDDVVTMQLYGQAAMGHAGIIAPHPYGQGLIHTAAKPGPDKVVVQRMDGRLKAMIREVYEWPVKV